VKIKKAGADQVNTSNLKRPSSVRILTVKKQSAAPAAETTMI
jgi:hypothetical protein